MTVNPTIVFSGALALVALTLLSSSAEAQLLFGSRLGEAHYQGDDTKIIMKLAPICCGTRRMVVPAPGPTRRLETAAIITILRSYKRGDLPCRDAEVNSKLKERSVVYVLPVCQIADGSWKIAVK